MGLDIEKEVFDEEDFSRFTAKLESDLDAFATLLESPGFGEGPRTLGAELEVHLVDEDMAPLAANEEVRRTADDPRIALELNRFNLELNARPVPVEGKAFAALEAEFRDGLSLLERAGREHGARVAMVGILPTLAEEHLVPEIMSDVARFRALSHELRNLRGGPFEVRIKGRDTLSIRSEGVILEGANTALQLHLRVTPAEFASHYNAAQLATGPLLAVAGNSPLFLGRRLWEETRVTLFKQAVDERVEQFHLWRRPPRVALGNGWVRHGALELFRQSVALHRPLLPMIGTEDARSEIAAGRIPSLAELRLHHGTVWSWNRAVYDPDAGGHLRIEMRALPSGPTVIDMMANAAFGLGLVLGLAPDADRWASELPFEYARHNLYRAAHRGLDAELLWPHPRAPSPRPVRAWKLALELLPVAQQGLANAGVDPADSGPLLDLIAARVESGQTGARYLVDTLDALEKRLEGATALVELMRRYMDASAEGAPVHTWKVPD